jgi:cell division septation protein DedD
MRDFPYRHGAGGCCIEKTPLLLFSLPLGLRFPTLAQRLFSVLPDERMKTFGTFLLLGICFLSTNTFGDCISGDCMNGQGTMTFPDGRIYEGQWKDENRNGQGTMSFPDGGRLVGQWKDGRFSGHGTMIYSFGIYEGQWKDGMKSGQGTMTYPDGSNYEGHWKDDMRTGQGIYTYSDGAIYVGQWKDDRKNGLGTYTASDNYKYVGQFKDGKTCGQGTMTFPDGSTYEGQWENDERNGQGKMIFPDGSIYKGQWKRDMRNGQGDMSYPDGSKYEGQWKDGRTNGQGTYIYPDGGNYVGQWKDGTKNGQGAYTAPDSHKYTGQFKNGKPEGQGLMTFPDGSNYEGEWKDSKFITNVKPYKELTPGQTKIAKSSSTESQVKTETITPQQESRQNLASTAQNACPYTIHVSSYENREESNCLAMKLRQEDIPAFVCPAQIPGKGEYHRVFVGFYMTLTETRKAASKLRGKKDLHPLEAKMPYAIQVGTFDSDQELEKLEADLRSKAYLAYSIPGTPESHKHRLLIGAFRTEKEAAGLTKKLQQEGFKAEVVRR